jgi:hypothetical protein
MLDSKILKETLFYNEETGLFIRLKRTSNCIKANQIACRLNSYNNYRQVTFLGKTYQAHRLAWFYVYGVWPTGQIDHINRNKFDNRLVNLRDCTLSENKQNSNMYKTNKTGFKGVFNKGNTYEAGIKVNGKRIYLGRFKEAKDAYQAYVCAAKKFHTHNEVIKDL